MAADPGAAEGSVGEVEVAVEAAALVDLAEVRLEGGGRGVGGEFARGIEEQKSMDHKLDEFIQRLKSSAGANLKAAALYGSAVTGEFHSKHSDLNILCILEQADAARIEALHSPVEWWMKQGHRAPLFFTLQELQSSADVFAIELLDMKLHHRMLHGKEKLQGNAVEKTLEQYFAFVETVTDEFDRQLDVRKRPNATE